MQTFTYSAKDLDGRLVKADVEAASVSDAAKLLISKSLFPLEVVEKKKGINSTQELIDSFSRITIKDKVLFTRQLATLVKAGLPLARALSVLEKQITNPKMLKLVASISVSIQGGTSLSQTLTAYPDVFNTIYVSMVEAGEASGNLDDVLLRLAAQEEKNQQIVSKIRSAFTYPIVVLVVLIAVMVMMITLVLPQVGKMYEDLKKPLPPFTRILLAISDFTIHYWYLVIMVLIGIGYAIRVYLKTPAGVSLVDRSKLNIPGVKTLMMKMYMARFARTLGSLIATGIPVLQALGIVSKAMNNVHLQAEIENIAGKVKGGTAMSKPVSESLLFMPMVGQMMAVGEETGTMGDSLTKVASYYEDEVDEAIRNISTLIEPATMVVLGVMVAFLIAAVLLPIYGLVSQLH